jgi:HK97 family phage portal protein
MKTTYKLFGIPLYSREIHESRSYTGTLSDPSDKLLELLKTKMQVASGIEVNQDTALTITAVWRAVNVISGSIAAMPLHVYAKGNSNSREKVNAHPVAKLLKTPSGMMTDYIFRETMQATALLWGNAYALIKRNGPTAKAEELIPVHPDDVIVLKSQGQLFYQVRIDDTMVMVNANDMIHLPGLSFNGLVGKSPVRVMAESLSVGIAAQRFGATFFGNGANIAGVIESPGELNDDVYNRLRDSWNNRYQGIEKANQTAILEGGMRYSRIGIPPNEAQFLETRQFSVVEVARMFGVQPHLLMDLSRSTNNNIEHQGIEFVTFTLAPWLSRWESELNRKMFTAPELEQGYYVEFNLNGLLRGDSKSRAEYYRAMFNIAALNPNEIRALENQEAYEGGNEFYVQGASVPVKHISEFYETKIKNKISQL